MKIDATAHTIGLADFELWQTARRLSRVTIVERTRVIRLLHAETGVQPATIDAIAIMEWLASHEHDWSDSTNATYITYLRAWFKYLQVSDRRADNPMVKLGQPVIPEREPRPISDQAVIDLLQARMQTKTRTMILLALLAGLRVHEIAKVRGEDFDLRARLLWVRGKGRKTKSIPLHPILVELVSEMPETGYWFPRRGYPSMPVHSKSVSDVVGRTMKRAGVRGSAHQLRHWYATTLLDDGADLRVVQELMRHKSIASTQIYTAVPTTRRRDAIDSLDVLRGVRSRQQQPELVAVPLESSAA
ncbi:tyrosine-type recombinase/integrase [Gordonia sihwensis]|uniref:tyrosine-type recombinase/integrase n=1 Tax=Gordonia sihwensis TaxID=173559 RepID=UPI0024172210|nr:tyrosine-type recombinase/integrase [Gordonia sihwensis]WFN93490.1 tyrosine-type recombinase/integrase [Gordonia sihwensis]